jgi:hypothetical protein
MKSGGLKKGLEKENIVDLPGGIVVIPNELRNLKISRYRSR